ncbi:MAG: hypothetical protein V3V70_03690, partial [Candidatus Scalindua sp.]
RIIAIFIAAGIAFWVYNDAQKWGHRTNVAIGWSVGVFLLLIIFLPLYIITELIRARRLIESTGGRKPEILTPCEFCGKHYNGNPTYCPHCGHMVRKYNP